jgi:uncharacterized protein (TIGR02266 family)
LVEHFRRTDPRYDRRVDVEISVEGRQFAAASRNLSLGGMFIETDELVAEQTTIQIRFKVPTQPEFIEVSAEVRWLVPTKEGELGGIGIRFHGLRARDVWALNRFFQT